MPPGGPSSSSSSTSGDAVLGLASAAALLLRCLYGLFPCTTLDHLRGFCTGGVPALGTPRGLLQGEGDEVAASPVTPPEEEVDSAAGSSEMGADWEVGQQPASAARHRRASPAYMRPPACCYAEGQQGLAKGKYRRHSNKTEAVVDEYIVTLVPGADVATAADA